MKDSDRWTDLHIHTHKSDGTFSVEEVFQNAKREGLSAIAITDHDTVAGVPQAIEFSKKYPVDFVPGVELSAMQDGREVHIIGLYVNWRLKKFGDKLVHFQKKRAERAKKIIGILKGMGLNLKYEELYEVTENMNNAGRLHIAKLLVRKKYAKNIKDAFNRFLAEERPAYVEKAKLTVAEAIELVREAEGISVLAHPVLLGNDSMIKGWKEQGLDGIEAFHPDHKPEDMARYLDIADELGLLVSGGSDCHGIIRKNTKIGKIKLPYSFYDRIKRFRENRLKEKAS